MTLFDTIDALPDLQFAALLATLALVWFGCRMLRHPR
jgi:hypothetical protein